MERADLEQWKAREVARLLALVETERRYYQEIVAAVPVGLVVISRDFTIVSANRAFRQALGLRNQDVLRRQLDEILHIQDLREQIVEVFESGKPVTDRIFEQANEATQRRLRVSIQCIRSWSEESEEEALLSIEVLPKLEEPAPSVVIAPPDLRDELPALAWEADPAAGRFTYVNQAAEELLGYPASDWTADSDFWTRRIHPEDREWLTAFYDRAAGTGDSHRCEYRALHADGRVLWLRDSFRVERNSNGQAVKFSGVSFDITERRRVEDQVFEARRFDSLSRVMSKAAHGFNNLLMIIGGYGDQLLEGLGADNPLRSDIEEILKATERVSGISVQLQAYTRRAASKPTEFNLSDLLKGAEPALRNALPANVKLAVSASADLKILADQAQLEQVLKSFLAQAIQGLAEGGTLSLETRTMELGDDYASPRATLRPGTHAALILRHDGQSLDPESRRKLFEPSFGQNDTTGKSLPLSAAYGLLRQNGGDAEAPSLAGQGAEYRLLFPLATQAERVTMPPAPPKVEPAPKPEPPPEPKPEPKPKPVTVAEPAPAPAPERVPAPVPAPAPAPAPVPAPLPVAVPVPEVRNTPKAVEAPAAPHPSPPTVLVVEDEAGIRMLMGKILNRQGYRVVEATRGDEALEIVEGRKLSIDLLVTDMVMPHMNGRELAEHLIRRQPLTKVLYVSGFTDDEAVRSGSLGPGTSFLQKPFTLGSLVGKVREILSTE